MRISNASDLFNMLQDYKFGGQSDQDITINFDILQDFEMIIKSEEAKKLDFLKERIRKIIR